MVSTMHAFATLGLCLLQDKSCVNPKYDRNAYYGKDGKPHQIVQSPNLTSGHQHQGGKPYCMRLAREVLDDSCNIKQVVTQKLKEAKVQ
mmetsp:Transcript_148343/g.261801  ORF Transcript_148343/g.261801 Transcript_148343/m.261801 type:complete len:89 (+) Transcript_148343:725-991(+)